MYVLNDELVNIAISAKSIVEKDYKQTYQDVGKSNAVYKGKQLPYLYFPTIYSQKDLGVFEELTKNIFNIVNKSIDTFIEHEEVRKIFDFDERLEELILIPHKYKAKVPMGRFDIFYYPDGSYKFCELNTDGTSAMNEETPLTDILNDTFVMKEIHKTHNIKRYELYQSWVDEVDSIYKEHLGNGGEFTQTPVVAIIDFFDEVPIEFEEFKNVFDKSGFETIIISPVDIECKNGFMYYGDTKIDIVYRRLVTRDLMANYDEVQGLVEGLKHNNTCVIGSIKSQIVHTKKYFEALHNDIFRKYFTDEELEYIDKHIPFTKMLVEDENFSMYVDQKDKFIIKPIDYYASKGVYAGKEFSKEKWEKLLKESIESEYVIQEFCEKSMNKNLHFDSDGEFDVKTVNNITGLFMYNEKLSGLFTRAGFNAVISDLNDGFTLSSLVLDE